MIMRLPALVLLLASGVSLGNTSVGGEVGKKSKAPGLQLRSKTPQGPPAVALADTDPDFASPIQNLKDALFWQLRLQPYQWINAVLAFVFGFVMIISGEDSFRYLLLIAIFMATYVLATANIQQEWALGFGTPVGIVSGILTALVVTSAAYQGYAGVITLFAIGLGFTLANKIVLWMTLNLNGGTPLDHWSSLLIHVLCIAMFVASFFHKKHVSILLFFSPLIGGALVSSSVLFSLTYASQKQFAYHLVQRYQLTPKAGSWIDFLNMLTSFRAEDYGVFAGSKFDVNLMNRTVQFDRVVGLVLWALLFVIGFVIQTRRFRNSKEIGSKKTRAREVEASSLTESMLVHD